MRILFLIAGKNQPSSRWRVLNLLPHFERMGVTAEVEEIPRHSFIKQLLLARRAKNADIVFWQKRLVSPIVVKYLRHSAKRLIYDFDDLVPFSRHNNAMNRKKERRFRAIVSKADVVIGYNNFLSNFTYQYGARKGVVIPNAIDLSRWHPKLYDNADPVRKVTLGWTGTDAHLGSISSLHNVWKRLAERFSNMEMKVLCNGSFALEGVPLNCKTFSVEDEPQDVAGFDIGIMPSKADLWYQAKTPLKVLIYFACGLPVVASPVGSSIRELVIDGVNGFLAGSEDEWVDKLSMLIEDVGLRRRLGGNARKMIEEKFSLEKVLGLYKELFESVMNGGN